MTYGWSILIIAIVLAALFSLGVFSNSNLGPRAQPNSCRVYRPNGPATTTNINLEGVCNGELPQYVAQFNGASSTIHLGTTGFPSGSGARSEFGWIYTVNTLSASTLQDWFGYGTTSAPNDWSTFGFYEGLFFWDYVYTDVHTGFYPAGGAWHFVGYTYAAGSSSITIYMDGQSQTGSLAQALNTIVTNAYIGGNSFAGSMSNVQMYNAALDANAVQSLYLEGIGGAPVEPQNLVGWWPLDGDTNDYSGNGNTGIPTNVVFTSSWTSGYTVP